MPKIIKFFFFFLIVVGGCSKKQPSKEIIYVGTFSDHGSRGLYVFEFDRNTDQLVQIQTVSDREGPNFQVLHPDGTYLYSVSGDAFLQDTNYGTVTSYSINKQTGMLTKINEQSVKGRGPAHVSIDPRGRFVYVSNYGSGSLSVFRICEDGSLSKAVDVVQHEGSSVNKNRQNRPHVHSTIPSADGRFIYVSDLGTDKIMIYAVDSVSGKLHPAKVPYMESTPGSGPRHFVIHPNGDFAYSAEELTSTVAAFTRDQSAGALNRIQRVSMLPIDFEGVNSAADIHISPDGRFLYASNRGHNSLVIYEINESNGRLTLVGHESTRGDRPRSFAIDRKGEFIFVANGDSDNVVVFRRDRETGKMSYSGREVKVPMAICVTQLFLN